MSASTDSEGLVKPNKSNESKWSWLRKIKVGLLTLILLVCLTILLLVPDQQSQQSLISVGRGQSLSQVVDDTIDEFSSTPEVLSLTIGGSLVPPDVTRLAPLFAIPHVCIKVSSCFNASRFSVFRLWVEVFVERADGNDTSERSLEV